MIRFSRIREYENLHILLWLLKDTCWVLIWDVMGIIMIAPTLAAAIHITWLRRRFRSDLFHNLAVCFWITGNSVWMIGEFFYNDSLRTPAVTFFSIGLSFPLYYYLVELPRRSSRT